MRGVLDIRREGLPAMELPFTKALFGGPTGCWKAPLVVAQPPEGCGAYRNGPSVRDSLVVVRRGLCSFHSKAVQAQQQGARGLIVVNDNDDTLPMPGPEDEDEGKHRQGPSPRRVRAEDSADLPAVMVGLEHFRSLARLLQRDPSEPGARAASLEARRTMGLGKAARDESLWLGWGRSRRHEGLLVVEGAWCGEGQAIEGPQEG